MIVAQARATTSGRLSSSFLTRGERDAPSPASPIPVPTFTFRACAMGIYRAAGVYVAVVAR